MIKTLCAICNVGDYKILYKENIDCKKIDAGIFSARRIPDKIHYQIVQCRKCGLVYSNPILEPSKIEKLYKQSKYTYGDYEADLRKTYRKYLKDIMPYLPGKQKLLEIGCGNGFFLMEAKRLGFKEVHGVEPSSESFKKADKVIQKNIINDIFKPNQFKKNFFDIICLFQVLDHLPDPNSVLQECQQILKPGGGILCINHDVSALSAKILGERSPIFDIEHTYLYSKNTLLLLFKKNKFEVVDVFDVANCYPFSYWLRIFPLPKKIKTLLEKFIGLSKLSERRIWLKAGNLGIFAKKTS